MTNETERQVLEAESAGAKALRRAATADWASDRQAETQVEVAKIDRLMFVDQHAFVELTHHHHEDVMGRLAMQPWEPGDEIGNVTLLEALQAGREVVAWFSRKVDLQAYGTELRSRVRRWLPEGQKLRFILEVKPEEWDGAVPTFDDLWRAATPTLPRKPKKISASSNEEAPFDTSPAEIARRIVRRFGEELLVVAPPVLDPEGYSTGYALDSRTGLWRPGGDPWARWLRKISDEMKAEAAFAGLRNKALISTMNAIDRVKTTTLVENVRRHLRAELDELREAGEPCDNVIECPFEDQDAGLRYIGACNGVVDLYAGQRLPPKEGRLYLVTRSVAVDFDPDVTHPAVDLLFAHLGPVMATWWWQVLGRGLRGPTKRLYAAVGEPNGGKSTLLNALVLTLGFYARKAARGVMSLHARTSDTQLSPGLLDWLSPVRFVLTEEEKRRQTLDAGLVKDLTGMGMLKARGLNQPLRQGRVTATTIMFSNTDSVPRLSLETEGMQDRYRELPYPKVPTIDLAMSEKTVHDPEFQTAFFARMVAWAARTPAPPADIPAVKKATKNRIREDMGEIGAFAQRIVRGDMMTLEEVWDAWCEFVAAPEGSTNEAGGIKRLRFSSTLRDYVTGLPAPKMVSVEGSKVRGWRGWRLLTVEEAEALEDRPKGAKELLKETFRRMADELYQIALTDEQLHRMVQSVPAEQFEELDRVFGSDLERAIESSVATPEGGKEWHLRLLREIDKDGVYLEIHDQIAARLQEISELEDAAQARVLMHSERPQSETFQRAEARYLKLPVKEVTPHIALAANCLANADLKLEGNATACDLIDEAVQTAVALSKSEKRLPESLWPWPWPLDPKEVEAAIKELTGWKEPNADGRSESPTGNGDQPSEELEIF